MENNGFTHGLIVGEQLERLVYLGYLKNVDKGLIGASTIDVRLGKDYLKEVMFYSKATINLALGETPNFGQYKFPKDLAPNDFILADTMEIFNLPDFISGAFSLRSSLGRSGLDHVNSCWIDAGYTGSTLTLELKNSLRQHTLILSAGIKIGQIKFFCHNDVGADRSYKRKGRYNNQLQVTGSKGLTS